jgi:lipoyl-dependent peroxiredoxin
MSRTSSASSTRLRQGARESAQTLQTTTAEVRFEKVGEGFKINGVHLRTQGEVPGLDEAEFRKHAEEAKRNCPVSQALAGTDITLEASLAR